MHRELEAMRDVLVRSADQHRSYSDRVALLAGQARWVAGAKSLELGHLQTTVDSLLPAGPESDALEWRHLRALRAIAPSAGPAGPGADEFEVPSRWCELAPIELDLESDSVAIGPEIPGGGSPPNSGDTTPAWAQYSRADAPNRTLETGSTTGWIFGREYVPAAPAFGTVVQASIGGTCGVRPHGFAVLRARVDLIVETFDPRSETYVAQNPVDQLSTMVSTKASFGVAFAQLAAGLTVHGPQGSARAEKVLAYESAVPYGTERKSFVSGGVVTVVADVGLVPSSSGGTYSVFADATALTLTIGDTPDSVGQPLFAHAECRQLGPFDPAPLVLGARLRVIDLFAGICSPIPFAKVPEDSVARRPL